ncbi:MAG: response regulator [Candidatus Sericytochromatia bacterium]
MKILLVDDNPANLLLIQKVLQRAGYTSDTAQNGLEALKRCGEGTYDVVFLDVMMPVMDGLETARMLAQQNKVPPRIVLVTAADPEEFLPLLPESVQAIIRKGHHFKDFSAQILAHLQDITPHAG